MNELSIYFSKIITSFRQIRTFNIIKPKFDLCGKEIISYPQSLKMNKKRCALMQGERKSGDLEFLKL
jgi:hypothetical protein